MYAIDLAVTGTAQSINTIINEIITNEDNSFGYIQLNTHNNELSCDIGAEVSSDTLDILLGRGIGESLFDLDLSGYFEAQGTFKTDNTKVSFSHGKVLNSTWADMPINLGKRSKKEKEILHV